MDLQSLILNLQRYWADCGCIIQQPYDVEVGAGTMHPESFLRVLGPEPYRVAYVQPSRRPADARYGENPFRLGRHLQRLRRRLVDLDEISGLDRRRRLDRSSAEGHPTLIDEATRP